MQIEVTNSEQPQGTYVMKFYADWCGPCKALEPTLEEIVKETDVPVYKVNVDKNKELCQQLGIRGIPTMIFFKEGKSTGVLVGNSPKHEILEKIRGLMQ